MAQAHLSGIPDHIVEQVRRSLGRGGGNLSDSSVNRLTHELKLLNGQLKRLADIEERRLELLEEREDEDG